MPEEVSGSRFLDSISQTERETREYSIENKRGEYITLTLTEVDRQDLFDQLRRLPSGFIDLMMSSDDELENIDDVEHSDDIDTDVDPGKMLSNIDGDTIDVFEQLFVMSAKHDGDLTSLDLEVVADKLDFETLFEVGGEVIDLSLGNSGGVKRFREHGSGKNS